MGILTELQTSKEHFYKVDILRGIAILAVFAYHAQISLLPHYTVESYEAGHLSIHSFRDLILYFGPSAFGWSGVELFLLISGFLIHYGFLVNNETLDVKTFYSKRFWRIYPPYIFVVIFFCVFGEGVRYYFATGRGLLDFFSHALLVHNLLDKTFFTISPSFWSLALEAQLYLIYPVFLFLRKRAGIRKTFFILLVVSVLLYVLGSVVGHLNGRNNYAYFVIKTWFMWGAGAFLAEQYLKGKTLFSGKGFLWGTLFFLLLCVSKHYPFTKHLQPYFATFMWLAFFEVVLTSAFIKGTGKFSKVLATIGICSYSIYLIHQPFLADMLSFVTIIPNAKEGVLMYLNLILKPLPVFLLIFVISYVMYQYIELKSIAIGASIRKRQKH